MLQHTRDVPLGPLSNQKELPSMQAQLCLTVAAPEHMQSRVGTAHCYLKILKYAVLLRYSKIFNFVLFQCLSKILFIHVFFNIQLPFVGLFIQIINRIKADFQIARRDIV